MLFAQTSENTNANARTQRPSPVRTPSPGTDNMRSSFAPGNQTMLRSLGTSLQYRPSRPSQSLSLHHAALAPEPGESLLQRQEETQPDAGAAAGATGKTAAADDGIGPDAVNQYVEGLLGKDWKRSLMSGGNDAPGESQARESANAVAAGGGATQVATMPNAPEIQLLAPVISPPALVALLCAYPFFLYALDHYRAKSDKWMHCWASCKIATYCTDDTFTILIGAGKEIADYICEKFGRPCGSEWADFVADLVGVACSNSLLTSCADCCDALIPKK